MGDAAGRWTAEKLRGIEFRKPPWPRRGYDEKPVRDALALVARRLDGRGHLSADDVRGMRFRKARIGRRGIDTEQVDTLLSELADDIART
ncbi:DivIVA domain-containing protein [Mycobacterium sp. MYCO198283]|uniref:DivIVA domain-containing protein n=1 Tax=Mycobacterium sp. MYCO198283 TaxID=2883505 RepID=UPI001E512A28|nr:DivIVA domain-containing protein [Mycobacterium sp. MYCO198283]MCG5432207.1 DivIVA domain-containing protein [Mycobacterium sp. MYCO198283]